MNEIRQGFINYLRANPKNFGQCTGTLADGKRRCAEGMAAEYLGMDLSNLDAEEDQQRIYDGVTEALSLSDSDELWSLNDICRYSFKQIASLLEERWSDG